MNGLPRPPKRRNGKHLINYKEVIRSNNAKIWCYKHDSPSFQSKEKRLWNSESFRNAGREWPIREWACTDTGAISKPDRRDPTGIYLLQARPRGSPACTYGNAHLCYLLQDSLGQWWASIRQISAVVCGKNDENTMERDDALFMDSIDQR